MHARLFGWNVFRCKCRQHNGSCTRPADLVNSSQNHHMFGIGSWTIHFSSMPFYIRNMFKGRNWTKKNTSVGRRRTAGSWVITFMWFPCGKSLGVTSGFISSITNVILLWDWIWFIHVHKLFGDGIIYCKWLYPWDCLCSEEMAKSTHVLVTL